MARRSSSRTSQRGRKAARHEWAPFRADERPVRPFSPHGKYRLALAYANTYHVGMSSLALHRVYDLIHQRPGWSAERFFTDGEGMPLSVETDTPLNVFGAVAFSVSFEEDYTNLVAMLDRTGIPVRRRRRGEGDPLVLMAGSSASINPLPMAELVDVFPLGAAENVLPPLLAALEEEESREAVLARLAEEPGFYVPAHHDPEDPEFAGKLDKLELTAEQMREPGHLPTTVILTPHTEFSDKYLIEMSRGCPEKCRYCWATFGMGTFRWHPTEYILDALARGREHTDQVGFVATAVGDHPEIEGILREALRLEYRGSVSSIRIPAVTEEVLSILQATGDRSITLAPETGNDHMRAKMGKPITNRLLLEKIQAIFEHGFTQLKMYFIIGLPDETEDDVASILELGAEARERMLAVASETGVIGHIHLGTNILVPKPYTPWQREPMDDPRSLKRKIALLKKGAAKMPNVSLSTMSIRQAQWQTYISRAGSDAADAIERLARGATLSTVLRRYADRIQPEVFERFDGACRWHFMRQRNTNLPALASPPPESAASPAPPG